MAADDQITTSALCSEYGHRFGERVGDVLQCPSANSLAARSAMARPTAPTKSPLGFKSFRSASIFPAGIEPMHTIKKAQLDRLQDKASTAVRSSTCSPLIIGRSPRFSESHAAIATEPFCPPTAIAFSLHASAHRRTTGQRAPRGHEHCRVGNNLLRCGHPQRH